MSVFARISTASVMDPAADAYNGDPASDVVSAEGALDLRFIVQEGAGATGTATITVEECTAIDGTGATAIAFRYRVKDDTSAFGAWADATASGFTTTATANKIYEIDVDPSDLSSDSPFVRLQFTESVDSPVTAGAVAQANLRYNEAPPVDILS